MTDTIEVRPATRGYDILLTAVSPISHHDPAAADKSNRSLFNRQKQIVAGAPPGLPDQRRIDAICAAFPVPTELADVFEELDFAQYACCALVRTFLDLHNTAEGIGVHKGEDRYNALAERVAQAAYMTHSVVAYWSALSDLMGVELQRSAGDQAVLALLTIPSAFGAVMLQTMAEQSLALMSIARVWHRLERDAAKDERTIPHQPLVFDAGNIVLRRGQAYVLQVPAVSGNSLRHQLVRGPSWDHLRLHLGIDQAKPGEGFCPPGVEALFYNGGNIEGGAKPPADAYRLAWDIRGAFPSLDLLGGVCDAFDLGSSRLRVNGWLVCRENAGALAGSDAAQLDQAELSVFDMLDEVTLTRQAGRTGEGQMLFSFETLPAGTAILVRLTLDAQCPRLTHGALVAALDAYQDESIVGGQSARGFGRMAATMPRDLRYDLCDEYEAYLRESKDDLRFWMHDGSLGCGTPVCT